MAEREPLSRERIVHAALGIVDGEGLAALSMRKVAAALDVEAMSLYHHVASKDDMVDGVFDLILTEADLPADAGSTAEWIRGMADGLRRLARAHPNAFPLLRSRPVPLADERAAAPFETGLALFAREGRTLGDAYAAVQTVLLTLLSLVALEGEHTVGDGPEPQSRLAALPAEAFPRLAALATTDIDFEDLWRTAISMMIRGLTGEVGA